MPVAREEDEEAVGGGVHEFGLAHIIVVVDDVGAIGSLGFARHVVEQSETLVSLHHILEVDILTVAFGAALLRVNTKKGTSINDVPNLLNFCAMKWVVMDSNHRRHSQQIYSLPHLATLVTTRCSFKAGAKVRIYF